jgi:hypothetical protein
MNPTESALLTAIKRRAEAPATRTDQSDLCPTQIAPAVSDADLANAESRLGFRIPALLRLVYSSIGNGGFGPGYGLIGLTGGYPDDQGHSAVDLYELFRRSDPENAAWQWPGRLLPICHWGCAIYSCIDCSTDDGPIVIWDPNVWDAGTPVQSALRPAHGSTAEWFNAWVEGVSIWNEMFPMSTTSPPQTNR